MAHKVPVSDDGFVRSTERLVPVDSQAPVTLFGSRRAVSCHVRPPTVYDPVTTVEKWAFQSERNINLRVLINTVTQSSPEGRTPSVFLALRRNSSTE